MACITKLFNFLNVTPYCSQVQPVRHWVVDCRMLKDFKKRAVVKEYGKQRLRIQALRKNKVLPPELKVIATEDLLALPRRSFPGDLVNRCVITSKPRGGVHPYRISRLVFRHLADNSQLSGYERAIW